MGINMAGQKDVLGIWIGEKENVPYKEQKVLMADLKKVYQALTFDEAEMAFEDFKEKWGKNTLSLLGHGRTTGLN